MMTAESLFREKRITVFGLGLNMGGVGTVAYLAKHGAREIIVTDIKSREELSPSLKRLAAYKNITYVLGQHRSEDFTTVDMVIKNPVIPWTNEYVRMAEEHHIPVEMDSSLFFALCKVPIIGVTGSKGKTTTAALIAHILEQAGRSVARVGISRVGVLGVLDRIAADQTVVFELSSWRLSALKHLKKSPHIAVVTNIFPDHLNYYKGMADYMADKENIFRFQKSRDVLITDFDNVLARDMAQDALGALQFVSTTEALPDGGAWISDETLLVSEQGKERVLLPLSEVPLRGAHNIKNVLLAALGCLSAGLSLPAIRSGIRSFPGVPHRLEKITEKNGVSYYDDTVATIPDATVAALRAFSEPVILLAGGSDKRLDFSGLAAEILKRSKKTILFEGVGTDKLLRELHGQSPQQASVITVVKNMAQAVALAAEAAEPGDVVLLSPGAASFGLFQNEFDRGEQFRRAVAAL